MDEDLQPEFEAVTFDTILAEVEQDLAGQEEESEEVLEDGPAEAGELPEDDPEEQEEEAVETDESEAGDEETEEEEEPLAPEPDEDEEAEAEPETPSEVEALRAELADLRARLEEPKQEKPVPPRKTVERKQLERAFQLALSGTERDQEEWESIPSHIRADAKEAVRLSEQAEAAYRLDPELRFNEQVRPFLERMLDERLSPVLQQATQQKVQEIVTPYLKKLERPADKQRFAKILRDIPGSDSDDLETQRKVLAIADRLYEAERSKATVAKKTQRADAIVRQQEATKKARKRTARTGSSKSTKRKSPPPLKSGDDLEAYARTLASGDFDL